MAEIKTITLTHKEVVEAFIRRQGISEGIWQLYAEFGIAAGNIAIGPDETAPAAVVPIKKLGLMRVDAEGPLALDASKVNPKPMETTPAEAKDGKDEPS